MWLIDTLRGFMTAQRTLEMEEHVKCVIRINGKRVCNVCYGLAFGYSRSILTDLMVEIQNNDRCASYYGNIHR
jgi:hypothetical protein